MTSGPYEADLACLTPPVVAVLQSVLALVLVTGSSGIAAQLAQPLVDRSDTFTTTLKVSPSLGAPSAAAVAMGAPYSLRQAVQDSLSRHPLVSVNAAARAAAVRQVEVAEWGRYPSVTADVAPGTARNSTYVLRVDQPLWAGGRITGQIDAAKAGEKAAAVGEQEARRSLVEQTAVAYMAWLGAQDRLRIAADGRAVFERLLAYVKRREEAGAAAQSDVSVAVARLALAGAQREQLNSELESARAQLQSLVVGPVGHPVGQQVPDYVAPNAEAVEADFLASSITLARCQAELAGARANAVVARGQMYPTVVLRLERLQQSHASDVQPNETRAMLAMQYTPGAGLSAASAAQAAESRVTAAAEQIRVDELTTRLQARAQWEEHQSAVRQLSELRPQIQALQETADSYMRQFEAGRRTWMEVLNIYREVLDARISLSRVETQHHQSALRLMANAQGTEGLLTWIDTTPQ